MIGQSAAFLKTAELIRKIARCDAPVLIEGETGTGKELAARAIHYQGARQDKPFIPVNCGAIPDALMENELFGHQKGAYTDAKHDHAGLVAHCRQGTLFLDEVDALSPKGQVTLLRFLQDQHYRPLGARMEERADVRIIAAANTDLMQLTQTNGFRADLLFRLMILHLRLPPLRERVGDVALLADHFLAACAERFGQPRKTLHPDTLAWFEKYQWPGNVRELENLVYREFLLAEGAQIHIEPPAGCTAERRSLADRRRAHIAGLSFSEAKARVIADFERRYLASVLQQARGNVSAAAHIVGKERRAFGKLLKKHGLDRQRFLH